jgi:hypothetical protein
VPRKYERNCVVYYESSVLGCHLTRCGRSPPTASSPSPPPPTPLIAPIASYTVLASGLKLAQRTSRVSCLNSDGATTGSNPSDCLMATPLASSTPASAKQPHLSYAERAKRAASSIAAPAARARPAATNGNARVSTQSISPASSSTNNTSASSNALTRPPTPPQPQQNESTGTTAPESEFSVPTVPKNSSKPPTNVWAARKEQMAQRVAATQSPAGVSTLPRPPSLSQASSQSENSQVAPTMAQLPDKSASVNARPPLNGITTATGLSNPLLPAVARNKIDDDPFVVRLPPHLQASSSTNASSSSGKTPPSIDDVESWPEMGKMSSSVSVSGSVSGAASIEGDRKESVTNTPRKSEYCTSRYYKFLSWQRRKYSSHPIAILSPSRWLFLTQFGSTPAIVTIALSSTFPSHRLIHFASKFAYLWRRIVNIKDCGRPWSCYRSFTGCAFVIFVTCSSWSIIESFDVDVILIFAFHQ